MTSACITPPPPPIAFSPEKFPPTYSAGEMHHEHESTLSTTNKLSDLPEEEESDPDLSDVTDFEFRLQEPVNMLPADQLFSDGKLFPLHFHQETASTSSVVTDSTDSTDSSGVRSTGTPEVSRIINGVAIVDSFLYSPKAPKCSSSKWKDLLGLKKLYSNAKADNTRSTLSPSSSSGNGNGNAAIKSIKHFLYRSSKSPTDSSVNLPLLNDTENEPAPLPSRHSQSSSSSGGHDPEDLPRLSLDSEKPLKVYLNTIPNPNPNNPPRMKFVKTRTLSSDGSIRGVSTESPRMNSSGKIVFHSLERSSSSPSSFNGGPRSKHRDRGMERSYSGNVRITPVLNVPVCSLRLFSSSQKHEGSSNGGSSNGGSSNGSSIRGASNRQQMNNKSKSDRT